MLRLLRTGMKRVVARRESAEGIALRAYSRSTRGWKRRSRTRWFSGRFGVSRAEIMGWNQVWMGGIGMLQAIAWLVGMTDSALEGELQIDESGWQLSTAFEHALFPRMCISSEPNWGLG